MPITDILIAVAIAISVIVGIIRGFVKEAISMAALLVAIWAALYFGPSVGEISDSWLSSEELRAWFGRVLVFAVILSIGGLLGWGISKLVRLSVLSGMDRLAGSAFGAGRGILLAAVFVLGGEFAGFDNDPRPDNLAWSRVALECAAAVGEIHRRLPLSCRTLPPANQMRRRH